MRTLVRLPATEGVASYLRSAWRGRWRSWRKWFLDSRNILASKEQ